jgi:hypothetical protein
MDWHARVRQAFVTSPHTPEDDVIEELAQHASAVFNALRAEGISPDEAQRRIEALIARWVDDAPMLRRRTDARRRPPPPVSPSAARGRHAGGHARWPLFRQPRFASLVVVTMALGIGATTALFAVTYGVLMRPLPWPNADRLVVLKETRGGQAPRFGSFAAPTSPGADNPRPLKRSRRDANATLTGAGDPAVRCARHREPVSRDRRAS